ncbi:MAG TPA: hypothetical protein PLU35_06375 [Phycisphaerales bacterium]|nr:hypothetical protein [Phycisphaerales bacterium]
MTRATLTVACIALLTIASCSSQPARRAASPARDAEMFARIAALEGEWEPAADDPGMPYTAVFTVSSAGSVVREIMFPGHAHEMTNLYHMDGPDLVLTHYCAAGNQPRMVAREVRETAEGTVYEFDFDSVSNLRPEHDHYMGRMTLTLLHDGTIRQDWRSYDRNGKLTEPTAVALRRKSGT